jgi:hypothetical protein
MLAARLLLAYRRAEGVPKTVLARTLERFVVAVCDAYPERRVPQRLSTEPLVALEPLPNDIYLIDCNIAMPRVGPRLAYENDRWGPSAD